MKRIESTSDARPAVLIAIGALAAAASLAGPAVAAQSERDIANPGRYDLKDGSTLVVAGNGWMRMFGPTGSKIHMKDGVPMETKDGRLLLMKEDLNWRQLRQFGTLSPKSR